MKILKVIIGGIIGSILTGYIGSSIIGNVGGGGPAGAGAGIIIAFWLLISGFIGGIILTFIILTWNERKK